jgi:hypothetical protein
MNFKTIFLVMLISLISFSAAQAKRSGFVNIKSIFKKPQNVNQAVYSEDLGSNSADLTLGGRRKFSSASIIMSLNNVLDQIVRGAEFTEANTGLSEDLDQVHINMLAAKFKDDSGFQYSTFEDDESTVRDVKIKVLKVSKKTGRILLRVKATFDNVRFITLDENSEVVSEERVDDITVFGVIKYDPADGI